ncbi:TRAP transporter small permease [Hydrogenophaga sp.]|uniref:TRAP transporter small permease n=1 Tax=Hydrogenophaga sp. TaxID=1904254 RepID=UPI002607D809|nr:TRAP transporter small permease [Hydrogenophaga sp.]MCW5654351.1 TRAP transporter small permease [Hydrogenophaga sp.]
MNRLLDGYCRLLDFLCALALATMVVLVFGNVVLRYGFNSNIAISEELSRWLFVWLTFLGAIVALKERGHLGTDVLTSRLPPLARRVCLFIAHALMLWATWLLLTGGMEQARINLESTAPVTGLSMAVFYASGIVFAMSAIALLLREMWRIASGQASDAELAAVTESEELASFERHQKH